MRAELGLGPGMVLLLIGRWCDRWTTRASGDFASGLLRRVKFVVP